MPRRKNRAESMTKVLVIRNVSYETEGMLEALLRAWHRSRPHRQ